MTDLTDEDRAAIAVAIRCSWDMDDASYDEDNPEHREQRLAAIDAVIYRAGLAAGRARAIEEPLVLLQRCAEMMGKSETYFTRRVNGWAHLRDDLDAAIRALNAPAAP